MANTRADIERRQREQQQQQHHQQQQQQQQQQQHQQPHQQQPQLQHPQQERITTPVVPLVQQQQQAEHQELTRAPTARTSKYQQYELPESAEGALCQTRCCICGLLTLAALRGCAINIYTSPAGLAWTAHMLSCAADTIAMLGSIPVVATATIRCCVHHRCLGSLLTLLLTATVCDLGAVVIFLSTAGGIFRVMGPVATDEGAPAAVAFIGVWECILLSSISLELALCLSAWQFYRAFREAGIYPPNSANTRIQKEVSPLEFLCEAEDVALLSDQCTACNHGSSMPRDDQVRANDLLRPLDAANAYSEADDWKLDVDIAGHRDQVVNRL